MSFESLPTYPVENPRSATRAQRRARWRPLDELFVVATISAAAIPPALAVFFLDSWNDKPTGSHANAWSYIKVFSIATLAAGVAWLAAALTDWLIKSKAAYFWFGALAVLSVNLSFCFWGSWVFENIRPK
jgi:hypothetical protein